MFRRYLSTAASTTASITKKTTESLLPLKFEQNLYATIKVHNRSYLVTKGDIVNLPFSMHSAEVGDVISFTKVDTLGSRNFTYHLKDGIDSNQVTVKGIVLEKTKKPMTIKETTKKRDRHIKHALSKHDLTVVRISDLSIN
jgi:ribosomal protein L21